MIKRLFIIMLLLCSFSRAAIVFGQTHYVMIETNMGNMKVMLYDDTPRTTANFLEKVRSGYYDDTLFGRVIESFMIQGGSPDSRNAGPGWSLGFGDKDMEIDGEIRPNHVPKKGALAAPHRTKAMNSDMSMFFIVQGYQRSEKFWRGMEKQTNAKQLEEARKNKNIVAMSDSMTQLKQTMQALRTELYTQEDKERYNAMVRQYNALSQRVKHDVDSIARRLPGARFFTDQEVKAYSTVGGAHHLYMQYTIYGEVVEGLDVIDKIAALETNAEDRPRKDVRMKLRVIK